VLEKDKLIALGIYGLVLFPSLTRVISLKAAIAFVEYENIQINLVIVILAKTILTLNHCRKIGKWCNEMLYIVIINMNSEPYGNK
jgi:hypothetical protein